MRIHILYPELGKLLSGPDKKFLSGFFPDKIFLSDFLSDCLGQTKYLSGELKSVFLAHNTFNLHGKRWDIILFKQSRGICTLKGVLLRVSGSIWSVWSKFLTQRSTKLCEYPNLTTLNLTVSTIRLFHEPFGIHQLVIKIRYYE